MLQGSWIVEGFGKDYRLGKVLKGFWVMASGKVLEGFW